MDIRIVERSLREYFGFSSFRPGQKELIEAVLAGRDSLGVLPTGGGKSLVYQLPATVLEGLTLVVSPLIALMKDQVDAFNRRGGRKAVAIHSNLAAEEGRAALGSVARGEVALLYVAPERLEAASFRQRVAELKPRLLVIDEAHCVNQWGHDFRPSYLALAGVAKLLRPAPVLTLTATATPATREEILGRLGLVNPFVHVAPFDRPNLSFEVLPCEAKAKPRILRGLLQGGAGEGSHIVYVGRRRDADAIASELGSRGLKAVAYHAGMDPDARRRAQEAWLTGKSPITVATIAFGMGIDKPDVRSVIHYQHPSSLEAYYQEAGRAGRDGAPARCITLFSGKDLSLAHFFIRNRYPSRTQVLSLLAGISPEGTDPERVSWPAADFSPEQINVGMLALAEQGLIWRDEDGLLRRENRPALDARISLDGMFARKNADYRRLEAVVAYCSDRSCHRAFLLRYFGERMERGRRCGNCSACRGPAAPAAPAEPELRARKIKPASRTNPEAARSRAESGAGGIFWASGRRSYTRKELDERRVPRKTGLAVLGVLAGSTAALPPSGIVNILLGRRKASVSLRHENLLESEHFGAERGRDYDDVLPDVLAMWAKGYLRPAPGSGRKLELASSGRSILERSAK